MFLRGSIVCGVLCSFFVLAADGQVRPRVLEAVDDARRVTLRGNVHSLARPEFDRGVAPADLQLDRMLLVLKRSDEQEQALKKLLDDQQDKASPQYHRWLTPEQFAQQFGPEEDDVQKVTAWLAGQGFQGVRVSRGRVMIEFSGTSAQVEQAFRTSIHKYLVNGAEHWANAIEPQIPAALWPVVAGVFTLHDFHAHPTVHVTDEVFTAKVAPGGKPQFTSSSGLHALGPSDFYTIYGFNPIQLHTSAKIAIVGRSNINVQDVASFHSTMDDQAPTPQVIVNGTDPGDLGGGEETEAVLDATWAGAIAPTAGVYLIVSKSTSTTDGVSLSEMYIVENNQWDVMSESFGDCEAHYTSAQATGLATLAQQAATQGITYLVAAGDAGTAGCDNANTETVSTHPPSVNLLASNPYVTAVGGTMFHEGATPSTYWNATNASGTLESAISYIPEVAWNESCAATQSGCTKPNILAGGGGPSAFFLNKPSWQSGPKGIPADGARDLPDVSLAAAAHTPYLLCLRGSCTPDSEGKITFSGVAGTSAATPAFAAIMGLVGQQDLVRLGQANYVLYRLAAAEDLSKCNASVTPLPASTCIFNDVTTGNNSVPGQPNYGTPSATYQSGTGYDLATGLGSVNVTNLVNQWNSVTLIPTSTTFTLSPTTAVHGTALNVTADVTPGSGTGVPTGVVWLVQSVSPKGNFVGDDTAAILPLDPQGTFSGMTQLLPGGTNYLVNAHYAGDGTFADSDSTPIMVTIQPEPTTLTFSVVTTDAGGNFIPFTSRPYGTPIYFKAQVKWNSGIGVPTGNVSFPDSISGGTWNVTLDQNGNGLVLAQGIAAGNHSITPSYAGDNSFSPSTASMPANFTIGQLATTIALTSQQTGQSLVLTATVSAAGVGSGPSGTVMLSSGSTVLATVPLLVGTSTGGTTQSVGTFDASQLTPGQYNIIASYAGDANYTPSKSTVLNLNLAPDFSVANRGISIQTVVAGQTASYINDIGVAPSFGYSSTVSLSCSVPAAGTTCTVNPTAITGANGIATVSVATMSRVTAALTPLTGFGSNGDSARRSLLFAFALLIIFSALSQNRRFRASGILALAALLVFLGLQLSGCGGGSSGPPPPPPGTPSGTYTVTVSGSAGATTHTTTLTLIVQ